MPLDAYDASVAVFVRGLRNLKTSLKKGEDHAAARATDPVDLLRARLAEGMYDLATQTHWAAEGAKLALARLVDIAATPLAVEPKTFAELYERIDATVASLEANHREDLETGLSRTIEIKHRGGSVSFTGSEFLTQFAIPNFFFHTTTAYGILRHHGVAVTKADFTGFTF